jgi:hypothetical protein
MGSTSSGSENSPDHEDEDILILVFDISIRETGLGRVVQKYFFLPLKRQDWIDVITALDQARYFSQIRPRLE